MAAVVVVQCSLGGCLTSESVESATLPLERIDDIHGSDSLPLSVLSVSDSITDDVLQEHLEDGTCLLVDQTRDTLDSTTAGQTANGGLGNTLDVITQNLAVPLGATLAESLASLAASRHCCLLGWLIEKEKKEEEEEEVLVWLMKKKKKRRKKKKWVFMGKWSISNCLLW